MIKPRLDAMAVVFAVTMDSEWGDRTIPGRLERRNPRSSAELLERVGREKAIASQKPDILVLRTLQWVKK